MSAELGVHVNVRIESLDIVVQITVLQFYSFTTCYFLKTVTAKEEGPVFLPNGVQKMDAVQRLNLVQWINFVQWLDAIQWINMVHFIILIYLVR